MTRAIDISHQPRQKLGQFQGFTFIGKSSKELTTKSSTQLPLDDNNWFLDEARVQNLWKITQIHTSKNLIPELKDLGIELGAIVELVSKGYSGSVVVTRDCGTSQRHRKLIGLGGEIAHSIVVTLAESTKQR